MPGFLAHVGAQVLCAHAGQATPRTKSTGTGDCPAHCFDCSTRYLVDYALPPNAGGPCVTAQWTTGTTRVTSYGQPLLVQTSTATCVPTGTPFQVCHSDSGNRDMRP